MKDKLYASVVPRGRLYKTSKMEYHIILWIDDMYLVDYVRHGKKAAYALKHAFEATGIAPAE